MTTTADPNYRLINQYLDAVLHAFSTGKRPHSDTREKIMLVIQAARHNDPELETYLRQEIESYNLTPGIFRRSLGTITEPTH